MRVFCYSQHLSGVGHFVRTHALACGLAEAHDVVLVDGGRSVPRFPAPPRLRLLPLPRIDRRAGVVVPVGEERLSYGLREERVRRLTAAVSDFAPDVVTIEHYPWSKWDLEEEILAVIGAARRARPGMRVVCSLRDVAPRTRHEAVSAAEYERRVLERLKAHFDAVLVHADPRLSRLDEHFTSGESLPVPWAYTGLVTTPEGLVANPSNEPPYAVLSAGGGARALPFLRVAIEAFRRLSARGELGALRLMVFSGLFMDPGALDALAAVCGGPVTLRPFSPDFSAWLRWSELSISEAGYNTSVDLLAARVPAVLVPNPEMSDQRFRAERMQAHGLAVVVVGAPPAVEALETAIRRARSGLRPAHNFALHGVAETRRLLERLHATGTLDGPPSGVAAPARRLA